MKYRLLFIFAGSCTIKAYCQNLEPKMAFLLEAEVNNSFIENKNINTYKFGSDLSLGIGINALLDFRLTKSINFLTGLRITDSGYHFHVGDVQFGEYFTGLSVPLYFEYCINNKHRIGIGTDLSYRTKFSILNTRRDLKDILISEVNVYGSSTIVTPIVLNYSRYFSTKQGRNYSLTLYLKKGLQTQETVIIKEYQDNTVINKSSFDFKGTSISIAFRYYLKRKANNNF